MAAEPTTPKIVVPEPKSNIVIPKIELKQTIRIPTVEELKNKKEEPKAVQEEDKGDATKTIKVDNIKKAWESFAEMQQAAGKVNDYLILHNRELKIDEKESKVLIVLDNQAQIGSFNDFKTELLVHLRKYNDNAAIQLIPQVRADNAPSTSRLYTDNDKFEFLAEKYPYLAEMKKRFGLDTNI